MRWRVAGVELQEGSAPPRRPKRPALSSQAGQAETLARIDRSRLPQPGGEMTLHWRIRRLAPQHAAEPFQQAAAAVAGSANDKAPLVERIAEGACRGIGHWFGAPSA